MTHEDMIDILRMLEGWTYADWQLLCREVEQQFAQSRAQVIFTGRDADEAIRMVEMAKDWYMPGSKAPAQTSLL